MTIRTARGLAPEALGPTVTIGEILVEIMAETPGVGFLEPQPLTGPYPSGAPAIFIDQVARLGGAAGIVGCVGHDDFGRLNIERLQRDGADVSAISIHPELPTGSAFVRYRPDGARDFVFNLTRSAAGQISLDDAAKALLDRAGHLHVMGSALSIPGAWDLIRYGLDRIVECGGSVSLDPNARKELLSGDEAAGQFAAILAEADLLLPSGDELFAAAGCEGEEAALAALFAQGVSEVALKRGDKGATVFRHSGERTDGAAFQIEEIDPTGAGDCFGAAYLTCRRMGFPPERALLYANAAGARNVTRKGPMEGAGSFDELDAFIANTSRA
ncbi:sugar kinase [Aureimonas ureilytica]|uniref:Sugar kinase n=1 Tax=Aureimonas ureilytica TaxID=401562 RepID=A0A175RBU1_9HYPH|nr:sugar kinase [Aureimonas ureilytica]KTQ97618.1 sugar kinase [Aureimonas ureilytica]